MVDLLPHMLAHVPDPHVSGLAVETPAPGIPQSELPDLMEPPGPAHLGVVGGDAVGISGVDVHPEELPLVGHAVLRPARPGGVDVGVPSTYRDVELSVGSERHQAAV